MVLVSACLTGQSTRYDGGHTPALDLVQRLAREQIPYLALCPELLGGLPIPRHPASIVGGRPGREGADVLAGRARVMSIEGHNFSAKFIQGAELVLKAALRAGVSEAYLKDRSPSCAYDPLAANPGGGPGLGVLAALLLENGIKVHEVRISINK